MRRLQVVIMMCVVAVAAAACTSKPSDNPPIAGAAAPGTPPAAAGEAKTEAAARQLAQTAADRFASGDWAGAWDLFAGASQKAIDRAGYVQVHTACHFAIGIPFTIKTMRPEGANFVVQFDRAGVILSYPILYEAAHWRLQLSESDLALYGQGPAKVIALRKAEGSC